MAKPGKVNASGHVRKKPIGEESVLVTAVDPSTRKKPKRS
jgi:hypothetical protein